MQALVCSKNRNLSLEEVPKPEPTGNQVRVAIKFAGICRSDQHILDNDIALLTKLPVVLGHEAAGIVDKVGADTQGISVGDAVSSETTVETCGTCIYCKANFYNLCPDRRILGYTSNGAFSEYIVVPANRVYSLAGLTPKEGALLEPTACIMQGLDQIDIPQNSTIVVAGLGPIGLLTAQYLSHYHEVTMYGRDTTSQSRYDLAYSIPNIAVATESQVADTLYATDKDGADLFIDCAGAYSAVNKGIELLKKNGALLIIGIPHNDGHVAIEGIVYKNLKVVGSVSSRRNAWHRAWARIKHGTITPTQFVTHTFPLSEYREAFRIAREHQGGKILFEVK